MNHKRFLAGAGWVGLAVVAGAGPAAGSGGELQSPSFRIPAYTINGGSGDGPSALGNFQGRGHLGELGDAMHESPSFLLLPGFSGQLKWLKEGLQAPIESVPTLTELPVTPWRDPGYYAPAYFGGTFWAADSFRWEAQPGGTWTFDSGVGSHYSYSAPGVDPLKPYGLHTYMEGWVGLDASGGPGGDWSNLVHLNDLPPPLTQCTCGMSDTVLVFEDQTVGGHGTYQYNFALSPWIDLQDAGQVGRSGKAIQFDAYMDMPVQNYVVLCTASQWGPDLGSGSWFSPLWKTYAYYPSPATACTPAGCPISIDLSWLIPPHATQVRIGVGVANLCRFFADCTGVSNSSPFIDNVRFVVHGDVTAPPIAALNVDRPMDSFPENGTLNIAAPGRVDSALLLDALYPGPGTESGDTLIVRGSADNMEVYVEFAAVPGPGTFLPQFSGWLNSHSFTGIRHGVPWFQARLDTAEVGGTASPGTWMTTYHESEPNFSGSDTDLDIDDPGHLANDIFPDDLFTSGTRLMVFYKARYAGNPAWFVHPDTAGGSYLEMEILPSSMDPDTTFNCVLYVNHQEDRSVAESIQEQLLAALPGFSGNFEGVRWDRFDVSAASSAQSGFGRPAGCTYGATSTQLTGYQTVLWNTGASPAFGLLEHDASVLRAWLQTRGAVAPLGGLYLNGDNLAQTMTLESIANPASLELLEEQCGTELVCSSVAQPTCPSGPFGFDPADCWPLEPEPGAFVAQPFRFVNHGASGNGCGESAGLDVLEPSARAVGLAAGDEHYQSLLLGNEGLSSVAHQVPGLGYRTVVDGLSLHHRRDRVSCETAVAAAERVSEVLAWFGTPSVCGEPSLVGVPDHPAPAEPTLLFPASVNPVTGGALPEFRFRLAERGPAVLELYDIHGRLVRSLFRGDAPLGETAVNWDGRDHRGNPVPEGVYFYRLVASGREMALKLIVLSLGS